MEFPNIKEVTNCVNERYGSKHSKLILEHYHHDSTKLVWDTLMNGTNCLIMEIANDIIEKHSLNTLVSIWFVVYMVGRMKKMSVCDIIELRCRMNRCFSVVNKWNSINNDVPHFSPK